MEERFSTPITVERARQQTALAPLLLQTEGLLVEQLADLLKQPVTVRMLSQSLGRFGLVRKTLLETSEFVLYYAVTTVRRLPETRGLITTMRRDPSLPLGSALQQHKLYAHKTNVRIDRTPMLPEYERFFGTEGKGGELWERSYAIVSPRKHKIVGVNEIFSPKLEALLASRSVGTAPHPVPPPPP